MAKKQKGRKATARDVARGRVSTFRNSRSLKKRVVTVETTIRRGRSTMIAIASAIETMVRRRRDVEIRRMKGGVVVVVVVVAVRV